MWLHISAVVVVLGCIFQAYMFMRAKRLYTKVGTPSASHNSESAPCKNQDCPVRSFPIEYRHKCNGCDFRK
jgi:hypothetical protein